MRVMCGLFCFVLRMDGFNITTDAPSLDVVGRPLYDQNHTLHWRTKMVKRCMQSTGYNGRRKKGLEGEPGLSLLYGNFIPIDSKLTK